MPRRLGQHFLTRGSVIHRILMSLQLQADDSILEIGPGRGALTLPLARKVGHLTLIEKDSYLAQGLKERLADLPNVTVVEGDFLKLPWEEIVSKLGSAFKVVSNLPYHVSTAILTRLLQETPPETPMILMFQKEVGERIASSAGGREYGSLSVFAQMIAKVHRLFGVSPRAFSPPPKVDSLVLKFQVREKPLVPRERWAPFEALLWSGFRQRRKMLRQNLKSYFSGEDAEAIERRLEAVGASGRARAEELSVEQWVRLLDMGSHLV